jgi:hypothetical protein
LEGREAGEVAANAFDDDSATTWLMREDHGFLEYRFANDESYPVDTYTLTSASDAPQRDPGDWTLSGSNDGASWVVLDQRRKQTFEWRRQTRVFAIAAAAPYRRYRLTIEHNHGAPMTQLAEVELLSSVVTEAAATAEARTEERSRTLAPVVTPPPQVGAGSRSGCNDGEARSPKSRGGCEVQLDVSARWQMWITVAFIGLRQARRRARRPRAPS